MGDIADDLDRQREGRVKWHYDDSTIYACGGCGLRSTDRDALQKHVNNCAGTLTAREEKEQP